MANKKNSNKNSRRNTTLKIIGIIAVIVLGIVLWRMGILDPSDFINASDISSSVTNVIDDIGSAVTSSGSTDNQGAKNDDVQSAPVSDPKADTEPDASAQVTETSEPENEPETQTSVIDENGTYSSKDEVALYIHTYGKLPSNFITKEEAESLGWSGGGLDKYAKGKSIGGDKFGNYEGLLPKAKGRVYTECDIDTMGASSRGAKRIVFSNDGLIFYTDDHYESFVQLY